MAVLYIPTIFNQALYHPMTVPYKAFVLTPAEYQPKAEL